MRAGDLALPPPAETSADVAARIAAARALQAARYEVHAIRTNAEADGELLEAVARPDAAGSALLSQATDATAEGSVGESPGDGRGQFAVAAA